MSRSLADSSISLDDRVVSNEFCSEKSSELVFVVSGSSLDDLGCQEDRVDRHPWTIGYDLYPVDDARILGDLADFP